MKKRIFAALFAGNLLFFFFYAGLAWALTYFKITPYGRFVAEFFKGRTREGATEYIQANKALFDSMLMDAARFANIVLTPLAGFVMGLLVGAVLSADRKKALIWSVIAALPAALLFVVKSGGEITNIAYLPLFLGATALGGVLGSLALNRGKKESI
ncbi:MAG: hypothetical protein A2054_04795 [Deltaproteobacteria bacterium GWA2_55_10]|nr:MAG: hypothetical protein A2054_04795 [Deltaproteobacteria bacterium GWA2_55_10]